MATISARAVIVTFLIFILVTSAINLTPSKAQLITQSSDGPQIIADSNLKIETVSKGEIKFPTSMAFLGPDDILLLEKNEGTVKRVVNGSILTEPLLDVKVANKNERGMLGIAIDPEHFSNQIKQKDREKQKSENTYVFLYYTESVNNDGDDVTEGKEPLGNRLYRYELVNNKLVNPKLLLDLPTTTTGIHNGGKIAIGPDDNVYLTIGDLGIFDLGTLPTQAQNNVNGQNPDGSGGILRITKNGHAADGGILGKVPPLNLYFAYGIRNSFGIDFDPISKNLWDTENGPYNGDEINLVKPGFNSGWGKVHGIWEIVNQTIYKVFHNKGSLVNFKGVGNYSLPEFVWNTTVGATDIKFLNSDKLGKIYENDIFAGDFHTGNLYHFDVRSGRAKLLLEKPLLDRIANNTAELKNTIFGTGFGGITDLEVGPDGYLYLLALQFGGRNCDPNLPNEPCVPYTSGNMGTLFRIVPVNHLQPVASE